MRIHRLDLIKYGKFTGSVAAFAPAAQDFHLIVGPNEAGKSTLRGAILDLLFGIPARSPLGFLHPMNELRLGALIGHLDHHLEFQRTKALRQTLRAPDDTVLADQAMVPFLGSADRSFFDHMFALDHTRLIKGGNSILNAEDDVGQILFQSAAGIASLGKVRDALAAEADKLWSPRKSAEREYYIAADKFDQATVALREATVRTKVWAEAQTRVDTLTASLESDRAQYRLQQVRRDTIERVRRTAPFLGRLRQARADHALLTDVVILPADAAALQATAARDLEAARQVLTLRSDEVDRATAAIATLVQDDAILAVATDVLALEQQHVQYRAHEVDIARREAEIAVLWDDVCHACRELGWPHPDPAAVRTRLPGLLVQRMLGQHMREHSGLLQTRHAAHQAWLARSAELAQLESQLHSVPALATQAGTDLHQSGTEAVLLDLRATLAAVQALGLPHNVMRQHALQSTQAKLALQTCLQALQPWSFDAATLTVLIVPTPTALKRLQQERQALIADQKSLLQTTLQGDSAVARVALEISQFVALHDPTTQDDVALARTQRDDTWSAIRSGQRALDTAAVTFEATIRHADTLADLQRDHIEEATTLHTLRQTQQRLQLAQQENAAACRDNAAALGQFDQAWHDIASACSLPGMALEDLPDWLTARQKALDTALLCEQLQQQDAQNQAALDQATHRLRAALLGIGQPAAEHSTLELLCLQGDTMLTQAAATRVRHDTLSAQWQAAQAQTLLVRQHAQQADAALAQWQLSWSDALEKAALSQDSTIGSVTGALELFATIDKKLIEMRSIQTERIDTMQADLARFAAHASTLAAHLAPGFPVPGASELATLLSHRLAQAHEARATLQRLEETLRLAQSQVVRAQEAIQVAGAVLQPLLQRAGVDSHMLLADCIARSDRKRVLELAIDEASSHLLDHGDGLPEQALAAEIDAADLTRQAAELGDVNALLAQALETQATLSVSLAQAHQTLTGIAGTADAAQAESCRQEALAQMSDAAQRYVKVHTATRLLRWSIERYREQKQGPLLTRASAIFASLTLGSFERLIVDFDRVPMALEGQRSDARVVSVAGMSDGTRDQLYLALRLAALELHLQQVPPLPFIADDLFINYDDARTEAGLRALADLSRQTQVIFLTHHEHLVDLVTRVFGPQVNIVRL